MKKSYRRRALTAFAGITAAALAMSGCALEGASGDDADDAAAGSDLQTVKVGYLHTLAVDGHLWLGMEKGIFEKHGLDIEPINFDTGIAESQALSGGSVDVAIMGGVLSSFPARGVGKVFLANDVEHDTAQLWVTPDSGIDSVEDLAGKKILTTTGTTAHVYLHTALKAAGVDPDSVEIVNSDMSSAVTSFIAGHASAVALWVPFDKQVEENLPEAKMIDSAKTYYPDSAILDGWVAYDDFYENDKETLSKLIDAWLEINALLVEDTEASLETIHESAYADDQELEDTKRQFGFQKTFSNAEWAEKYENGEVLEWIGQAEQTFVEIGGLPEFVEPSEFVDTQLFLDSYEQWKDEN